MLKKCILIYIWTASAATGCRPSLLRACNLLLTVIRRDRRTGTINICFSKEDLLADLSGIYTNKEVRGMLDKNEFNQLDLVFSIGTAFVDRVTCEQHSHPMTHMHTSFPELRNILQRKNLEHVQTIE